MFYEVIISTAILNFSKTAFQLFTSEREAKSRKRQLLPSAYFAEAKFY